MQQQPVYCFKRALDDVLVSPMDRVASLKRDDSPPAFLLEGFASLARVQAIIRKGRVSRPAQQTDRAAQQPVALVIQRADAGMRSVRCQINSFGLALLVVAKFLLEV